MHLIPVGSKASFLFFTIQSERHLFSQLLLLLLLSFVVHIRVKGANAFACLFSINFICIRLENKKGARRKMPVKLFFFKERSSSSGSGSPTYTFIFYLPGCFRNYLYGMRRFSSSPGMDRENAEREREKGKETNTYPAVYKPGTIKAARKTITLSLLAAAGLQRHLTK